MPQQVYTLTSDNGANMLKAVCLLEKETLQISADELNNDITDNSFEDNTALDNTVEMLNSDDVSDTDEIR